MKNLKKFLITGLACGTMLTGLAGCSKTETDGDTAKADMVEVEVIKVSDKGVDLKLVKKL